MLQLAFPCRCCIYSIQRHRFRLVSVLCSFLRIRQTTSRSCFCLTSNCFRCMAPEKGLPAPDVVTCLALSALRASAHDRSVQALMSFCALGHLLDDRSRKGCGTWVVRRGKAAAITGLTQSLQERYEKKETQLKVKTVDFFLPPCVSYFVPQLFEQLKTPAWKVQPSVCCNPHSNKPWRYELLR